MYKNANGKDEQQSQGGEGKGNYWRAGGGSGGASNKHRLNMRHRLNSNNFNQLFWGGESAIQSVVSLNVNENIGRVQEGGTCVMAIGPITDLISHDDRQDNKDDTGLGCWSVITLNGDGFKTHILCGYNLCYNNDPNSSTSFQQHRRYFINKKKVLTNPRSKFRGSELTRYYLLSGIKLVVPNRP